MVCGAPFRRPWSLQVMVYGACSCSKCCRPRGRGLWGAWAARSVRPLLTIHAELGVRCIEIRAKGHGLWGQWPESWALRPESHDRSGFVGQGHGESWFMGKARKVMVCGANKGLPIASGPSKGHDIWGRHLFVREVMVYGAGVMTEQKSWFVGHSNGRALWGEYLKVIHKSLRT